MNNIFRTAVVVCLALTFISPAMAAQEITAEKLGEFYPAQWEGEAVGKTAFSNLQIPGHQKASTSRLYAFGKVEFIYYDKADTVYARRVEKLKASDRNFEDVTISGCPAVLFTKKRVIADLGGEIIAHLECYTCDSKEDLMARFEKIDPGGFKGLLE